MLSNDLNIKKYNNKDLNTIIRLVEENEFKKIFITGNINSGKTSFCKEFVKKISNFKFIELDKERDKEKNMTRSEVLSKVIEENKNSSYIIEHYQLLDENYYVDKKNPNTLSVWKDKADMLILLYPQTPIITNYDQKEEFEKLNGKIIYYNPETGTYAKKMNKLKYEN